MRALQVITPTGPRDLEVRDVEEPAPGPDDVLVEVHRVGISFPDLLLSRGEYQLKPEPPFTLGVDFAGTVVSGPEGLTPASGSPACCRTAGRRSGSWCRRCSRFPLPDALSFDEGAALPMNYLTAHFALVERGGLREGETVLVHGAAGGVGTATIQVAKGYGARVIAVVSTDEKAAVARAGRRRRGRARRGLQGRGQGAHRRPGRRRRARRGRRRRVHGLAALCWPPQGRLLVVGFAAGQGIPEVKVNRLLLNNVDVRGVGWGAYAMVRPGLHAGAVARPRAADGRAARSSRRSGRRTPSRTSARPWSTWTSAVPSASPSSASGSRPTGAVGDRRRAAVDAAGRPVACCTLADRQRATGRRATGGSTSATASTRVARGTRDGSVRPGGSSGWIADVGRSGRPRARANAAAMCRRGHVGVARPRDGARPRW